MSEIVHVSLRLPRALRDALAELATSEHRSMHAQLVHLIEQATGHADPVRRRAPRRSVMAPAAMSEPSPLHHVEPDEIVDAPKPDERTSSSPEAAAHRRTAVRLRERGDEDAARFQDQLANEIEVALQDE